MVDGERLWILDFDLYCWGDVGLDIGNFLGHLTEQSVRSTGNATGLAPVEQTIEDEFVRLAGEETRASVRTYALLTLARHIFLSTKFEDRAGSTENLLTLTEERLAAEGVF
jgi:hypothetical protein